MVTSVRNCWRKLKDYNFYYSGDWLITSMTELMTHFFNDYSLCALQIWWIGIFSRRNLVYWRDYWLSRSCHFLLTPCRRLLQCISFSTYNQLESWIAVFVCLVQYNKKYQCVYELHARTVQCGSWITSVKGGMQKTGVRKIIFMGCEIARLSTRLREFRCSETVVLGQCGGSHRERVSPSDDVKCDLPTVTP